MIGFPVATRTRPTWQVLFLSFDKAMVWNKVFLAIRYELKHICLTSYRSHVCLTSYTSHVCPVSCCFICCLIFCSLIWLSNLLHHHLILIQQRLIQAVRTMKTSLKTTDSMSRSASIDLVILTLILSLWALCILRYM